MLEVVPPHGCYEARVVGHETWTEEVLAAMDAAVRTFGSRPPRQVKATNPLAFRGHGVQPGGHVCLAIYARQMLGGGAPAGVPDSRAWIWDGPLRPDGPAVIDSLTLDAGQWATLAPPKAEVGTTWSVPEAVARHFCRVLIPSSDQSTMPRPEDAKRARLTGTVEAVEDGRARIRLAGVWEAMHLIEEDATRPLRGAATADGYAIYDLKLQAMQSVLLVFSGTHGRPNDEAESPTGAVVEWRRERSALTVGRAVPILPPATESAHLRAAI